MTEQEYFRSRRARRAHPDRKTLTRRRALLITALLLLLLGGAYLAGRLLPARDEPPWVIAIDPGHGGKDLGAVGLVNEIDLTMATARALYELLEADPDFIPLLTHEGEGGSTKARAKTADRRRADLFLSIHGNSDPTGEGKGFECFPELPGHGRHKESLRFAKLVCRQMESISTRMRGDGGIRYAYYDDSDTKHIVEAYAAEGIEELSFGVLENTRCPALLVEQCFVTNQEDVDAFCTEEGIRTAAEAYYRAIREYFGR